MPKYIVTVEPTAATGGGTMKGWLTDANDAPFPFGYIEAANEDEARQRAHEILADRFPKATFSVKEHIGPDVVGRTADWLRAKGLQEKPKGEWTDEDRTLLDKLAGLSMGE